MTKLTTRLAMIAALLSAGAVAPPAFAAKVPTQPGELQVIDKAGLFSPSAIAAAKTEMHGVMFRDGLTLTIDSHQSLPSDRKAEFDRATNDTERTAVFEAWAKSLYTNRKATGIYVLISKSPGVVIVLTDKETRTRGFTKEDEIKLREMIRSSLRQAASQPAEEQTATRDGILKSAVEFVATELKDTTAAATATDQPAEKRNAGGSNIAGWVCLGLCVMLGAWLVIGLIRAFSGGGGAGGPGGPGGGGFMTSLFGGLFGAMAGMWLYNSMFGGGGMFGGSDATAGESGTAGDTGSGDLADDTGSAGYDGGDYGGGDFGGGDFGDF